MDAIRSSDVSADSSNKVKLWYKDENDNDNLTNLSSIDFKYFNTSKVTDMS